MPFGRRLWLLIAVALALTGCRAAGTGSLSLNPRPGLAKTAFDLDDFVAQHNRNAERVESLEAQTSISVDMARMPAFHVDGHMALERPRNFKLELAHHGVTKADIGSNADEFWYWVANPKEPYVFWCPYDELESSALSVTYQPDWIIEALGLKPIPPEEAKMIRVRNGIEPGTSILSFPVVRNHGEPYSRELIVSNGDLRIKKLLIFSEKPRTLVAEAQPSSYQGYPTGSADSSSPETCYIPQKLKLDWKREKLVLDVALEKQTVEVNRFEHSRGEEIFIEPAMEGYTRLNLAELSRGSQPGGRTMTRETMPPPESRGFRLGRPWPLRAQAPIEPNVSRVKARPEPESSDPPLPTFNDLVGAPVSRPPNAAPLQPPAFSTAPGPALAIEQ